jgi:peptidoglycan/LPS O-acetylase OafA/YrhL
MHMPASSSLTATERGVDAGTRRLAYLDGIRGLAILAVLGSHWRHGTPWMRGGYIGVDVFFVLSGFLITGILIRRPMTYAQFIVRRATRLCPALLGALAGGIALAAALPGFPLTLGHTLRSALLVPISPLLMANDRLTIPFGITWSLAIEWYFYLAWPLFVAAIARRNVSAAAARNGCLIGAAVLYGGALLRPPAWFYFAPPMRFAQLLVGAALAYHSIAVGRRRPPNPLLVAGLAGLAAAWVIVGPSYLSIAYRLVGAPLAVAAAVLMIRGAGSDEGLRGALAFRPLAAVGLVSYSLYLWHYMAVVVLDARQAAFPIFFLVAAVSTAIVTVASYWLLERPYLHRV